MGPRGLDGVEIAFISLQARLACPVEHEDGVPPPQVREIPQEDIPFRLEEVQPRESGAAVKDGFGRRGPLVRHQEVSPIGWPLIDDAGNLPAKIPPAVELPCLIRSRGEGQKGLQQVHLDDKTH